jgi:hypothetical protein
MYAATTPFLLSIVATAFLSSTLLSLLVLAAGALAMIVLVYLYVPLERR